MGTFFGQSAVQQFQHTLRGAYTADTYLGPEGHASHHQLGFRGWTEMKAAWAVLDGIGASGVDGGAYTQNTLRHLADSGVAVVRRDLNWGQMDYATPTQIDAGDAADWANFLTWCDLYNLRPIITLGMHHNTPVPKVNQVFTLATDVLAGATSFTVVESTAGLTAYKCGITMSDISGGGHPNTLIITVAGQTLSTSRPFATLITAGNAIDVKKLLYPCPHTSNETLTAATMAGFAAFTVNVGNILTPYFGVGGFDLELYNELTFGSRWVGFNYFSGGVVAPANDPDTIRDRYITACSDAVAANPGIFGPRPGAGLAGWSRSFRAGSTRIHNGFANTGVYPTASTYANMQANGRHPYRQNEVFPADQGSGDTTIYDALDVGVLYNPDTAVAAAYIPTRTMIAGDTPLHGASKNHPLHAVTPLTRGNWGRYRRSVAAAVVRTPSVATEAGVSPNSLGLGGTLTDALGARIKEKFCMRGLVAYLARGYDTFCYYEGKLPQTSDKGYNITSKAMYDYLVGTGGVYPTLPADVTSTRSPFLKAVRRLRDHLETGLDGTIARSRSLSLGLTPPADGGLGLRQPPVVAGLRWTTSRVAFAGTTGFPYSWPDQKIGEQFIASWIMVSATKLVLAYWVATDSVVGEIEDLPFELDLTGVRGALGAAAPTFTGLDLLTGLTVDRVGVPLVSVKTQSAAADTVTLNLSVSDYPRLITFVLP